VLAVPRELQTASNLNVLTVALLLFITILATFLEDLGMVTAVGGGTLGRLRLDGDDNDDNTA
jgi:hypothetical protein